MPKTEIIRNLSCTVIDCEGNPGAGKAMLSYDSDTPLHVKLSIGEGAARWPVSWTIGRDILARRTPGLADVRCDVDGLWTMVRLSNGEGSCDIQLMRAEVDAFLARTTELVPYGSEVIDIDDELAALLGGAR